MFVRRKAGSLLRFAFAMTMTGAAITAIYLLIVLSVLGGLGWRPEIFVLAGGITATGGVTALCCAFLLCRRRSQSGR